MKRLTLRKRPKWNALSGVFDGWQACMEWNEVLITLRPPFQWPYLWEQRRPELARCMRDTSRIEKDHSWSQHSMRKIGGLSCTGLKQLGLWD